MPDGGIIGPITELAAVIAAAKRLVYPCFFIASSVITLLPISADPSFLSGTVSQGYIMVLLGLILVYKALYRSYKALCWSYKDL